jgi:hypothetical protein
MCNHYKYVGLEGRIGWPVIPRIAIGAYVIRGLCHCPDRLHCNEQIWADDQPECTTEILSLHVHHITS